MIRKIIHDCRLLLSELKKFKYWLPASGKRPNRTYKETFAGVPKGSGVIYNLTHGTKNEVFH